jgi:hypothetical protein
MEANVNDLKFMIDDIQSRNNTSLQNLEWFLQTVDDMARARSIKLLQLKQQVLQMTSDVSSLIDISRRTRTEIRLVENKGVKV